MSFLGNYGASAASVVKLFAFSLRSAPTADLVAVGAAYLDGGGTKAQLLNVLYNASIPQSPFANYASTSTDTAFVTSLLDNLAYGATLSSGAKTTWAGIITPLLSAFPTRGDFVMALTGFFETNTSTDADLVAMKALLAGRAETAAAFAQSPAGAVYSGLGFDQLLAPLALPPSYALTATTTSADEGSSVNFFLTTTGLAAGTVVNFSLTGTGITSADVVGGLLTGSFTLNAAGVGSASITLAADATTEGLETLRLELPGSAGHYDVAVNDTSLTPVQPPTYVLTTSLASQSEGASLTYTLTTTNLVAGTLVPFTLSGSGITTADIVGGSLSGNFTLNGAGVGTVNVELAADLTTEGAETLRLALVNAAATVDATILDTSVTPPPVGTPDTTIIADVMTNANAKVPPTPLEGEIKFDSYLTYDLLNQSGATPARMSLAALIATNATAGAALNTTNSSADRGNIPQVSNQSLFKFDLGNNTDRVDYSRETGKVVAVFTSSATIQQNVMVNDDGTDIVFNGASDRVDQLTSVEEVVSSAGGGVLDLTNASQNLQITFSKNFSLGADVDLALDRATHRVELADLASGAPVGPSYVEFRDAGGSVSITQTAALWRDLQGSDRDETVVFTSYQAAEVRANNLRGGNNTVKFNDLTRSILVDIMVSDWVANTNPAADTNATGLITATTTFTNGDGVTLLSGNQNITTSHSTNNGVAAGMLKVVASQDAEDAVSFSGDSMVKLFVLGQTVAGNDVVTAKLGVGASTNSLELSGFEFLRDNGGSDDVYTIDNIVKATTGSLRLQDTVAVDHDAIQLSNEAMGSAAVGGSAAAVNLVTLNGAAPGFSFDFDVLDLSKVTSTGLTITGTADLDDELVAGTLGSIVSLNAFESLVLTSASLDKGTSLTLDLNAGSIKAGATTLFAYGGSVLSAGGLTMNTVGRSSYVDPLATGMTLTVVDSSAGAGATVWGGNGADTLTGAAGNDTLRGGAGNDTLDGGFTPATGAIYSVTFNGGAAAFTANGDNLTIAGVTLTAAAVPAAFNPASASNQVMTGSDSDQIGAAFAATSVATWRTALATAGASALEAAELQSVTYDGLTNMLALNFSSAANAATLVGADFNTGKDLTGGTVIAGSETLSPLVPRVESADIYSFEKTAALNGVDTINNFNSTDKLDVRAFIATSSAGTSDGNFVALTAAGLNGVGLNQFTFHNKASLSAADFNTTAALVANKVTLSDNGKAVFAVTGDADGVSDGSNDGYKVYYVQDIDSSTTQNWQVTLVANVTAGTEFFLVTGHYLP